MDSASLFNVKVSPPPQWLFQTLHNITHAHAHLQDKVVLVTGGAKGIGRMISEGFVANGAKVYISSRDAKACEQTCKELNALGTSPPSRSVSNSVPSLTYSLPYRQRYGALHNRGFLQNRRLQEARRRIEKARKQTPRLSQQLRLELGSALRRVPRQCMDTSPNPQPHPRLHQNSSPHSFSRSCYHPS